MGLQFILGNAGGGKTWYIEHQAAAMASKDMKRQIFVVVPDAVYNANTKKSCRIE